MTNMSNEQILARLGELADNGVWDIVFAIRTYEYDKAKEIVKSRMSSLPESEVNSFIDWYTQKLSQRWDTPQNMVHLNVPKCPTCSSTNIQKISGAAKAAGAMTLGLLSKTARSQFKCNNCGYKW